MKGGLCTRAIMSQLSGTVAKKTLKIITNFKRLESARFQEVDVEYHPYPPSGLFPSLQTFIKSFSCDYILINGTLHGALKLAFFRWLVPFTSSKLVVVDVLLSHPIGLQGRLKACLVSTLFRKIDLIMLYYKKTDGLQKHYGIAPEKFRYVPFKINQYELIQQLSPTDEGYIFCGGKTRRDFITLFEAVKGLNYPVKIVTTPNEDIAQHGSYLDESVAPPNVEIIRLDGSPSRFIAYMAAARLVIMPIKPDICGAGIGIYIMAMALKKCVIISSGPGAEDVLSPDQAIIVPAGDSVSLRTAIVKAFSDPAYRSVYENNGYKYAMGLQGEERLIRSLIAQLLEDYMQGMKSSA